MVMTFSFFSQNLNSDLLLREKISRLSPSHPTDAKRFTHTCLLITSFNQYRFRKRGSDSYEAHARIISSGRIDTRDCRVESGYRKPKENAKEIFSTLLIAQVEHLSTSPAIGLASSWMKAAWCGLHYYLYPLYEKISRETRREIREIMMFWHMKEIVGFVQNGKAPPKTEVDQRKDFYVIMLTQGKLVLASGNRAQKLKETTLRLRNLEGLREFRVAVAYRGKVRGKALIMRTDDAREIMRIKERALKDIILVAGMTNPTMIPLAREAKAIVTDEGGVTCHAAIISREFKIPCVVGTRVATRVLKNGDMVEVDANEGGEDSEKKCMIPSSKAHDKKAT